MRQTELCFEANQKVAARPGTVDRFACPATVLHHQASMEKGASKNP